MPIASALPEIAIGHLNALNDTLAALRGQVRRIERWGRLIADRFAAGSRLLAAGDDEAVRQARHLAAELAGHGDTLALDGPGAGGGDPDGRAADLAALVTAEARAGDVVLLLSATGHTTGMAAAARAARAAGATVLTCCGCCPNPLANAADDAVCVPGTASVVHEAQLVAVDLLCAAVDAAARAGRDAEPAR
ncbi:SIS domain-containing protein [Amycolatopsis arida]|uniref:SIS domain-containing protein n=1 Tax=Amycolatopsis arida TaxID=587909 RepID=UPI00106463F7|nr:SIS domain-containing protein [Amycolatopsis arida]